MGDASRGANVLASASQDGDGFLRPSISGGLDGGDKARVQIGSSLRPFGAAKATGQTDNGDDGK
jgi:hypothetical protein